MHSTIWEKDEKNIKKGKKVRKKERKERNVQNRGAERNLLWLRKFQAAV